MRRPSCVYRRRIRSQSPWGSERCSQSACFSGKGKEWEKPKKKRKNNKSASFVKGNFFKILSLDTFFRGFIESFLLSIVRTSTTSRFVDVKLYMMITLAFYKTTQNATNIPRDRVITLLATLNIKYRLLLYLLLGELTC